MLFADLLRAALADRQLCAADLSRRAGLTEACVSRLLAGRRQPSLATAAAIAQALDVSLDSLAGRSSPAPSSR